MNAKRAIDIAVSREVAKIQERPITKISLK